MGVGVTGVHPCKQSEDPRRAGHCACGAPMRIRYRNPELEAETFRNICVGLWFDPEPMITHMQRRANHPEKGDGGMVRTGVDWLTERLEELADDANYSVWDLQDHFDDPDREQLVLSMREIASAYERVRRVRERRREEGR